MSDASHRDGRPPPTGGDGHRAPSTPVSLLEGVRERVEGAWDRYVDTYGPIILRWCCSYFRRSGFPNWQDEAEDAAQGILMEIPERLRNFTYDPARSYGAYLRTQVRNACHDVWRRLSAHRPEGQEALLFLTAPETLEELIRPLAKPFEEELCFRAIELVAQRINARGNPRRFEAFRLTMPVEWGGEGLTPAEAATRLGVEPRFVHEARSDLLKMIREEVDKMTEGPDE